MRIAFNEIEETILEHFFGGEGRVIARMYVDPMGNKIMRGRMEPGCSIGLHRHTENMEVIFVESGSAKAICDGVEERLGPGDCHYCPKGSEHTVINDGIEDFVYRAVVPMQP